MLISNPVASLGEELAAKYLAQKGYQIVERNFRKGYGEIDIIAVYQNILVFIEVKTRKTGLFGGVRESISGRKIRNLVKTAQFYKLLHPQFPNSLRIDAVFIELSEDSKPKNIEHIENISGF